jgi:multidrug efflux pump subunit AcrA (membrane-fusion protein)
LAIFRRYLKLNAPTNPMTASPEKRTDFLAPPDHRGYWEDNQIQFNPFPGLRPFSLNESHLFFGREGQVDKVLGKLAKNRSVAIMGTSGSGKSSLIYCGVVPVLYGGFMTETGPNWQIIRSRPGIAPMANLASSIVDLMLDNGYIESDDRTVQHEVILSVLNNSPYGLVEVVSSIQKRGGANVCLLLDQVEEVFRFSKLADEAAKNEASQYIALVLGALSQREVPVYVVMGMRSDFINDCTEFPGLTEVLNSSNYVVPKMTREQKRMVIEGPVAVGGGIISGRLTKRLLADLEDVQDALPILQHAMMRTWDYWVRNREEGEPMDIRHYNAIGRIEQALSQHANEAFDELSAREKEIAEVVFKSITEKNQDNQGMRRPGRIIDMAEIAGATESEVIKVVDHFRKPGRSFLMPGAHVPLNQDSLIEISHESMMRIWSRLSGWVESEYESSQMFKRLSEASAMYQIGRTGLWRPPDLQLALNWQKKQNPTRTWAQRYDSAFERAIVFLDTSRITYEAELKNQEMLQKRMLRRARVTNIILSFAFLVAMIFFFFGLTQRIEAENNAEQAQAAAKEAEDATRVAVDQTKKAEDRAREVQQQQAQLEVANKSMLDALTETERAKVRAEANLQRALRQERIAKEAQKKEEVQKNIAEQMHREALTSYEQANALRMLSIAQSMEAKAETMEDAQMSGLLALQGYLFHTKYMGKKYDPYVFRGLYYATAKLKGYNYNALTVPGDLKNRMTALAVSQKSYSFFTTGTDGRIFSGNILGNLIGPQIGSNSFPNRAVAVSPDEQHLVVATDSSAIQIYSLLSPGRPKLIEGHKGFVNDVKFLPDNSGFISVAGDKTIRFTSHISGQGRLLAYLPFDLKSISISMDGKSLVGAANNGQVILFSLIDRSMAVLRDESPNRVLSVAFHPTQNRIAYGLEMIGANGQVQRGLVKILDLTIKRVKELSGHKAGVSDVEFSPDGSLLAGAGLDRKLQMWVVDHEEDLPIVMDNNNGNIWSIAFTSGSDYLLASCNNGEIRIWPTDPKMLADFVCPNLTRPMTQEEWGIYVGSDITVEETCEK